MLYAGHKWWKRAFWAYWLRHVISPRWLIERSFPKKMGYPIDFDAPKTFNEKIQWLKLYHHDPAYIQMVDKAAVKEYVSSKIWRGHVIPTIKIYDNADEVNLDDLPDSFVLKCTHDSGSIVLCKEKSKLDLQEVRRTFRRLLNGNYYYDDFEWPYKGVKPRIIVEPYLVDESHTELKDYKIFCFDGEPKIIEVDFDRYVHHKSNIYTVDWKLLNFSIEDPVDWNRKIEKPKCLAEMLKYARILSEGIPFVRTDFYCIGTKVYFGELTFYPSGGWGRIEPRDWDRRLGDFLALPSEE